ncbi:MAG: hypothetical protein Kow00127_12150 [Bacteroidales bacterium]
MLNRISLLITFLLVVSFQLAAQDDEKGDKRSREILDRMTLRIESYKTILIEFTYKMENTEADINEEADGTLKVMGDKYRLEISGQTVICDGSTIWTYIADAEEVQINNAGEDDEALTPDKLLTSYNKDYRSKFIREDVMYGEKVNIIDLTPIEGKSFYKVRLILGQEDDRIHDITIFDKNNSTYSYIMRTFTPNVDFPENTFTFDPKEFPDADVIDMR